MGAEGPSAPWGPSLAAFMSLQPVTELDCGRAPETASPAAQKSGFGFHGGTAGRIPEEQVRSQPSLLCSQTNVACWLLGPVDIASTEPDSDFAEVF